MVKDCQDLDPSSSPQRRVASVTHCLNYHHHACLLTWTLQASQPLTNLQDLYDCLLLSTKASRSGLPSLGWL